MQFRYFFTPFPEIVGGKPGAADFLRSRRCAGRRGPGGSHRRGLGPSTALTDLAVAERLAQ
jgi:hypothetical protein